MWFYIASMLVAAVVGYMGAIYTRHHVSTDSIESVPQNQRKRPSLQTALNTLTADDNRVPAEVMKALKQEGNHARSTGDPVRDGRLIIVNKALPLHISKNENGSWNIAWDDRRSWLSNLRILKNSSLEVIYVGMPSYTAESKEEQESLEEALEEFNCYPVYLTPYVSKQFYGVFCKTVLWPILHYVTPLHMTDFGRMWDESWQGYVAANTQFAAVTRKLATSSKDYIWIHNYHLFVLPSFLRKKLPRAKIGMFIHTPFPSSDIFKILPCRENIIRGILGADLVGFHTYDFARHFLSACKRLLDLNVQNLPGAMMGLKYSGRDVSVLINHVGIIPSAFQEKVTNHDVVKRVKELKKRYGNRKIILGIDDVDFVRASFLKFQAYTRFLESHPDLVDKVAFIQIILPSSSTREAYKSVKEILDLEIKGIKERFGSEVLDVVERASIDMNEYVALNMASDIAVVSLFWDGLNLAPFEYTASQDHSCPGTLIVSEFMGCARSLSGVLRVNPWNIDSVVAALEKAISFSMTQRIALHTRRFEYVSSHDLTSWAVNFLRQLESASQQSNDLNFVQVGWGCNVRLVGLRSNFVHLDVNVVHNSFHQARLKVMMFDYDGTLVKTKGANSRVAYAAPSESLKENLKILSDDDGCIVFILSGRERKQLQEWFRDIPNLGLAAEKGCFIRWPEKIMDSARESVKNSSKYDIRNRSDSLTRIDENLADDCEKLWDTLVPLVDYSWKDTAMKIIKDYTRHTDGSWIEDKELAIVWHFDLADHEYGRMQALELGKYLDEILENPQVEIDISDQNYFLEIKPASISKGAIAPYILRRVSQLRVDSIEGKVETSLPFVLCVGDDRSDEEMFLSIDEALSRMSNKDNNDSKLVSINDIHHNSRKRRIGQSSVHVIPSNSQRAAICKETPNTFTCTVGIKPSNARYYAYDENDVSEILSVLADSALEKQEFAKSGKLLSKKFN